MPLCHGARPPALSADRVSSRAGAPCCPHGSRRGGHQFSTFPFTPVNIQGGRLTMETYLERARKVRENQCLHLGQTGFRYGRPNRPTNASEVLSGVLGRNRHSRACPRGLFRGTSARATT